MPSVHCATTVADADAPLLNATVENEGQLAEALHMSDERMYRDKSDQKELSGND